MVRWPQINGLIISMLEVMVNGLKINGFNLEINGGIDMVMVLVLQMILKQLQAKDITLMKRGIW